MTPQAVKHVAHAAVVSTHQRTLQAPSAQRFAEAPPTSAKFGCIDLDETEWSVERILARRRKLGCVEYKVRWSGYDSNEDSWESEGSISPEALQRWRKAAAQQNADGPARSEGDDWSSRGPNGVELQMDDSVAECVIATEPLHNPDFCHRRGRSLSH